MPQICADERRSGRKRLVRIRGPGPDTDHLFANTLVYRGNSWPEWPKWIEVVELSKVVEKLAE